LFQISIFVSIFGGLSVVKNCRPRLSINVAKDEKKNNKNDDKNRETKNTEQRINQIKYKSSRFVH
jgi:hypothetical protein